MFCPLPVLDHRLRCNQLGAWFVELTFSVVYPGVPSRSLDPCHPPAEDVALEMGTPTAGAQVHIPLAWTVLVLANSASRPSLLVLVAQIGMRRLDCTLLTCEEQTIPNRLLVSADRLISRNISHTDLHRGKISHRAQHCWIRGEAVCALT